MTAVTVAVVAAVTGGSAWLLGRLFQETHEENAGERVVRVSGELQAALSRSGPERHVRLPELFAAVAAGSGKVALVGRADGLVTIASDPALLGVQLAPRAGVEPTFVREGEKFERFVFEIAQAPGCEGCHPGPGPLGWLAIDSPRTEAEHEVADQRRSNLVAGVVLAAALSLALGLTQLLLLHRPLRRLRETVERLRQGDLTARAKVERMDELGEFALTLNSMAEAIAAAQVELDRTHRAELAQSEKLASLGELTSTIAHEIKNPLAGIIGALRVLEQEAPADAQERAILGKVLAQAERLSATAVELLEFARPLRASLQPVDLREVLDRTLFFVERQAVEQRVELRRRYPAELPEVLADPDLLKQVFLNLVLNGLQAMPHGGVLELELHALEAGCVELAVRDQGPGIPSDQLPRLFRSFYTTKQKGTGLGLFVARQLVETQRGELRVESELGRGATFFVRLPAAGGDAKGRGR